MTQLSREGQFQYLALRAGIRQQLAWVAWCEEAMSLLGSPVENPVSKPAGQPVTVRESLRESGRESSSAS